MYLFAFLGGEADGGTYVVGLQFEVFLHGMIVSPHFVEGERLVEDDDEVVAEILGHASAVACGVATIFCSSGMTLMYEPRSKASTTTYALSAWGKVKRK